MGKVHDFSGGGDRFDGALELGDVGIGRSKIGEKGDEVGHASRRLAPREDREKGKKKGEGKVHRLFLEEVELAALIKSQNFGFSARSSSSERGNWERKAKSLREFLWRTRWMTRPGSVFSK